MSNAKQAGENSMFGSEQSYSSDYETSRVSAVQKMEKKAEDVVQQMNRMEQKIGDMMQQLNSIMCHCERRFEDFNQRLTKLQSVMEEILATTGNPENKIQNTKQRCLKLKFSNINVSSPILTGDQIKGGGNPMQLSLVDDSTGILVDSGPEASAEVEIVALEGEWNDEEGDVWTADEFKSKIVQGREGKSSILVGNVGLKLNKGVLSLSEIKFRSSAYHSCGVFKLGARVVNTFHCTRVIEAKTKSFQVKDYREKYHQKHYPPSASDEVWRLVNIGRGGPIHDRLTGKNVKSVQDFQTLYTEDPEELKRLIMKAALSLETLLILIVMAMPKILGLPAKKFEDTVRHAQTCKPDNLTICCQQNIEVLNVVGETTRQISDCKHADSSKLTASVVALQGVDSSDLEASHLHFVSLSSTFESVEYSNLQSNSIQDTGTSEIGELDSANSNTSFGNASSSINPTGFTGIEDFCFHSIDNMEMRNSSLPSSSERLDAYPTVDKPLIILYTNEYNMDELLSPFHAVDSCNSQKNVDASGMLYESQTVSVRDPWRILFTVSAVSKWLSRRKRTASFDESLGQKKQRIR